MPIYMHIILLLILSAISIGAGYGPQSSIKTLPEIKSEIAISLDLGNTNVEQTAVTIAKDCPGEYNINQVCEIFNTLRSGWFYFSDPSNTNKYKNANRTLQDGKISDTIGMGNCDDFAILMSSLIASLGGSTRITFASNMSSTEGHAYCEVFLGLENDSQVDELINWIKAEYNLTEIPGLSRDDNEVWLNLDWWADYPGGPYYECDEQKMIVWRSAELTTPKIIPLIDNMDSIAGWETLGDDNGSSISIGLYPARKGLGINISYDLKEGGFVGISKNVSPDALSQVDGLNFSCRAVDKKSTVDLRLVYADGTELGYSWRLEPGQWEYLQALYKDFKCLRSGDNCSSLNKELDPEKVQRMEFIISGQPGNENVPGKIIIDHVNGVMNIGNGSAWARADEMRREAQALRLSSQSEELLKKGSATDLINSAKLGVESLDCLDSIAGENTLRSGLSKIARPIAKLSHNDSISSLEFGPDGRTLATASYDMTARIWDLKTGQELHRLKHDNAVNTVKYSSDGKKLITASFDNTSRIWDAQTGLELHRLKHDDVVWSAIFSPDGTKVATASGDSTTRIWDAETGMELFCLNSDDAVRSVIFSPDGTKLATANDQRIIGIWDAKSGQKLLQITHDVSEPEFQFIVGESSEVRALESSIIIAFDPSGKMITTALKEKINWGNNSVRTWNVSTGEMVQEIKISENENDTYINAIALSADGNTLAMSLSDMDPDMNHILSFYNLKFGVLLYLVKSDRDIDSLAISPDCRTVASANSDGTISIRDIQTSKELHCMKEDGEVNAMAFSHDGKALASICGNITSIWDLETESELYCMTPNNSIKGWKDGMLMVFSPDGGMLATEHLDGFIHIWDVRRGIEKGRLSEKNVKAMRFSKDGKTLIAACRNGTIFWDADTGTEYQTVYDFKNSTLALNSDGKILAEANWNNNTCRILDVSSAKVLASMEPNVSIVTLFSEANSMALSPDGNTLAIASNFGDIGIWDVKKNQNIWGLIHLNYVDEDIVFSPNGTSIATVCSDGNGRVIDAPSGQELAIFPARQSVVFSPDGTQIATDSEKSASIWSIGAGKELHRFGHNKYVSGISFSPDGKRLATMTIDGIVRIWPISTEDLKCQACQRLEYYSIPQEWRDKNCGKCSGSSDYSANS